MLPRRWSLDAARRRPDGPILARNVHVGRHELDLVAVDPGPPPALVVVEVRWRAVAGFGLPEETVDHRKRPRVRAAAYGLLERGALPDGVAGAAPAAAVRPRRGRAGRPGRGVEGAPPPRGLLTAAQSGGAVSRNPGDVGAVLRLVLEQVMDHPVGCDVVAFQCADPVEVGRRHRSEVVQGEGADTGESGDVLVQGQTLHLGEAAVAVAVRPRQESRELGGFGETQ